MPDERSKQRKRNEKRAKQANKNTRKNLKKNASHGSKNTKTKAPSRAQQINNSASKPVEGQVSDKGNWVHDRGVWRLTEHGRKNKYKGRLKDDEDGSKFQH